MTGIERLHEFVAGISPVTAVCGVTKTSYDREHMEEAGACLRDFLASIADQIERELREERDRWESDLYEAQVAWNRVTGVCLEMERHCLYNEDTAVRDVARWARELRHAMKSDASDECDAQNPSCHDPAEMADVSSEVAKVTLDPADDVSMSAYDLLPKEDRDAIAWVRDHGGLDSVKRLLDWVVGHCSTRQQLDFDFWLSGRVMHELGFEEDMADRDEVERRLLSRLMPEGYEWPRYESGEPLRYEDRYVYDGREREVWHVDFDSCGEPTILNKDGTRCHPDKGERVMRSAPKVLDVDGVEIRVGDAVYALCDGTKHVVEGIEGRNIKAEGMTYLMPANLTHRAPVLAADGKPLREGEHVYHVETGTELVVKKLPKPGEYQAVVVFALPTSPASHLTSFDPDLLTHERPVADTWERLEEDAEKDPCGYFGFDGEEICGKCPASGKNCEQTMARDLVRRAKKLAEVSE